MSGLRATICHGRMVARKAFDGSTLDGVKSCSSTRPVNQECDPDLGIDRMHELATTWLRDAKREQATGGGCKGSEWG